MVIKNGNISKIRPVLNEVKQVLLKLYGDKLVDVILFGSYARGDEHEESDIDVAVIIEGNVNPVEEIERINKFIYDLDLKHDVLISVHPISKQRFLKGHLFMSHDLKKEGISLV